MNKLKYWNQPIGGLISQFIDFDRESVATLQAQLLAIRFSEEGMADKTNLFALSQNGILDRIETLGISEQTLTYAREEIDSGKGMLSGVPPFGLIAKMHGFVDGATCDALLTAQAGARTLLYIQAESDAIPVIHDAVYDTLFTHVGKSDKEPAILVEAQSSAHLALMHRAMRAERGKGMLASEFKVVGDFYLSSAHDTLHTLQQADAADELAAIIKGAPSKTSLRVALTTILPAINEDVSVLYGQGKMTHEETSLCAQREQNLSESAYGNRPSGPGPGRNFDKK